MRRVCRLREVLTHLFDSDDLANREEVMDEDLKYHYRKGNAMNRIPESIQNRIEGQLDMILRQNPA